MYTCSIVILYKLDKAHEKTGTSQDSQIKPTNERNAIWKNC